MIGPIGSFPINRSLIMVYFKPAFFELIKHKLEEDFTLDEINKEPLFFLLPPLDEEHELENLLNEYEESIITAAIDSFFKEDQNFPSLDKNLDEYFKIEFYGEVQDLAPELELGHEDDDIIREFYENFIFDSDDEFDDESDDELINGKPKEVEF